MNMLSRREFVVGAMTLLLAISLTAQRPAAKASLKSQPKEFTNWPAGTSPQEIGKRIAERYVAQDYLNLRRKPPTPTIIYPEACTWYGARTFAHLSVDADLTARLIQRFEPLLGEKASLIPPPNHVDNTVFGTIPLEIYREAP